MSTATLPARRQTAPDPAPINGDAPLTAREARLYTELHAARNARNAAESRGIPTRPAPRVRVRLARDLSPPRAAMELFFAFAAASLAPRFADRPVTILDLGCGSAPCLPLFEAAGYRGAYLGLDLKRNPRWSDHPTPAFRKRLILGDCLTVDPASLPPLDLIISSTALEHIADDAAAIERLTARLAPGGVQIHCVPAEGALPLYGPHGWRQYSPRCLRALFPSGTIYRAGGAVSARLHRFAISGPAQRREPTWMVRRPRPYALVRDAALALDLLLGNRPPTMYGVIA